MLRRRDDPLREILAASGRGVVDAVLPSVAFVVVWLGASALGWWEPILLGGFASVLVALAIAVVRWRGGERPRAAAVGLLIAVGATLIALYTGRAEDFFLPRIVANAGSLAAWLVSIAVRWPLLGLVVGAALGKPRAWREDPDLVRGYCRASWLWAAQYALRLLVFLPLWAAGATVALGIAQVALTWPLVLVCVLGSWPLVRSALPADHPGPRHPVPVPDDGSREGADRRPEA
ncbi:DUF3159 domain-containing protein [Actinomycetospora soli]|uniref:DUF3159 domain-containing protein n=1 Tax=Actinomycetospora soli TaxID=2893887 RepID=UPI001E57E108|nr:DUF3159 domain-containing protein [Actinomycetospora soli]MCD2190658.1 DUF3159 domain-containing protein [Actinomycetospora soli]